MPGQHTANVAYQAVHRHIARRDADGWYWFVGRAEDVIPAAGHLVSPVEVETALAEHPAVAVTSATGPDGVTAHVTLAPGFTESDALREELHTFCRYRLGPARAPRRIIFTPPPPRTPAGMIIRHGPHADPDTRDARRPR